MQALALLVALASPAAAARADYVPCKQGLFRCGNLGNQDGSAGGTQSNRYEAADGGDSSEEEPEPQSPPPLRIPPPPGRAAPRVFRVLRPGGMRAEPGEEQSSGDPDEVIHADQAASVGGASTSNGGDPIGHLAPLRTKLLAGDKLAASALGNGASSSCASSCPADHPFLDSSGRCYNWTGGGCSQKCLNGDPNNCLRPSYSDQECSCSYPVDFSPAYREGCSGNPQKTFLSGTPACTPPGDAPGDGQPGDGAPPPAIAGCGAPAGFSCQISPITYKPPIKQCGGPPAFSSICGKNIPFDLKWCLHGSPQFYFHVEEHVVHVHPIKFSSTLGFDRAFVQTQETADGGTGREFSISATPGSMTPVNSSPHCSRSVGGEYAAITITFSGSSQPGCSLKKDTQYYLNVKAPSGWGFSENQTINYFMSVGVF